MTRPALSILNVMPFYDGRWQSKWQDGSSPVDSVQEIPKFRSPGGIDRFHESNPSLQVCAKIGVPFAVLIRGTVKDAVRQNRFQEIEVVTADVDVLVDDKASQMLALAHGAGLAEIDAHAFVVENCGNRGGEARDPSFEIFIA